MSWSRWKMMAGVLSASIGGLATVGGQCPKPESNKNTDKTREVLISADNPAQPQPPAPPAQKPAEIPSVALPNPQTLIPPAPMAAPPTSQPIPSNPVLMPQISPSPMPPTQPSKPALDAPMAVMPAVGTATQIPSFDLPPAAVSGPAGTPVLPERPVVGAVEPGNPKLMEAQLNSVLPQKTNVGVVEPPHADLAPLVPASQGPIGARVPPQEIPHLDPPAVNTPSPSPAASPKPAPAVVPAAAVAAAPSRLRIVLRVGEGEPTFEVRSGDDLLLKVISEKVDIKSPEKGSGLSSVKAAGKVHFVGFGAEGTCDELSFMAGNGEVALTGNVKIQVKDKLGRVESELTTESVKYKIDSSSIGGSLRP